MKAPTIITVSSGEVYPPSSPDMTPPGTPPPENDPDEEVPMAQELELQEFSRVNPDTELQMLTVLGTGSYGKVWRARHLPSGTIVAVKQVPIDDDLDDLVTEIRHMKQCRSPHIVSYYGSYLSEDTELWIVMELCETGSVMDIMDDLGAPFAESAIVPALRQTLLGLSYLHSVRKIHRDIKAANLLLTVLGHVKLADFGVTGQLTDTMAKRNTVIGTPYWMAPEVILEEGHDVKCDIWSLGITVIEMAERKPPYFSLNPMRAIFIIPSRAPPTFQESTKVSSGLSAILARCLTRDVAKRSSADELLMDPFLQTPEARSSEPVRQVLADALVARQAKEAKKKKLFMSVRNDWANEPVDISSGSGGNKFDTLKKGDMPDDPSSGEDGRGSGKGTSVMGSMRRRHSKRKDEVMMLSSSEEEDAEDYGTMVLRPKKKKQNNAQKHGSIQLGSSDDEETPSNADEWGDYDIFTSVSRAGSLRRRPPPKKTTAAPAVKADLDPSSEDLTPRSRRVDKGKSGHAGPVEVTKEKEIYISSSGRRKVRITKRKKRRKPAESEEGQSEDVPATAVSRSGASQSPRDTPEELRRSVLDRRDYEHSLKSVSSSEIMLGRRVARDLVRVTSSQEGAARSSSRTQRARRSSTSNPGRPDTRHPPLIASEEDPSLPSARDVARVLARVWNELRLPSKLSTLTTKELLGLLPELDVHEAHEVARLKQPPSMLSPDASPR